MPKKAHDATLADWMCTKCLFKTGPKKGEHYVNRGSRTSCNGGCGAHKGRCHKADVKTTGSPTRSAAAGKADNGKDKEIARLQKELLEAKKSVVVVDASPPDSASGDAGDDGVKQLRTRIQLLQSWVDDGADLYAPELADKQA